MTAERNTAETKQQKITVDSADWLTVARHTCPQQGTYSRETFLALWGACVRWIGDLASKKSPITVVAACDDAALQTLLTPLQNQPHISLVIEAPQQPRTNVLLIAGQPIHAAIYCQQDSRRGLQRTHGGWTFAPGEVATLWQAVNTMITMPVVAKPVAHPAVATVAQALIHGLEEQTHALDSALQEVHTLNQKVVDNERLAAIGQLCSVVAHEIRNPLGLIDLYAKLIEGQAEKWVGELCDKYPELPASEFETLPFSDNIAMVREAIGGLEVILSELTQYSRPLTLATECQHVVPLVQRIVDFYQPKYAEKGVQLTCQFNPALEAILQADIDSQRFRQALLNLLKNALEASKADTTVTVTIASRENDHEIYIKVADEGSGIPERAQEKLFTPYFSTKGNGTGLGLAHSRKILQAHGGRVELLRTQPDVGTTFALVLPRVS